MGPGPLIAIGVILLYSILGPLVLLLIYVLFDQLSKPDEVGRIKIKKDPALWSFEEIDNNLEQG